MEKESVDITDRERNKISRTLVFWIDPEKFIEFVAIFKGKDLHDLETIVSMNKGKGFLKLVLYFMNSNAAESENDTDKEASLKNRFLIDCVMICYLG